ncbi:MAG: GGDEF domain-containing protein [Myxococcales bacterium]|nr:GGDEF domain-containing protein [Myxococcales bacterium]MDD9972229.1 GGDEF domain-containing protein [Myxococcales bacterium]
MTGEQRDRKRGRPLGGMAATQQVAFDPDAVLANQGVSVGTITLLSEPNPGAIYPIDDKGVVIGRTLEASLHIDDAGLSRKHARIYKLGGSYFIEDLGSTNGTSVNGQRISAPQQLFDGMRILLGKSTILRFSLQDKLEQDAARRVYEQTVRDALTGLHNRRYLEDRMPSEFSYSVRHGVPLGVMVVDADHFKRINDTHGHQAGDAVLQELGKILEEVPRMEDLAIRYGGEEFIVLARGVGLEGTAALAERVRARVMAAKITFEGKQIPVTVSIGVAATDNRQHQSAAALVAAADSALYRAKNDGRNRVETS